MIRPLSDNIVLKKLPEEKTSGGVIFIVGHASAPTLYEVVAVGPGNDDVNMAVAVGDIVYISAHSGTEVKLQDETYLIVRQKEILATVQNKEEN